MINGIKSHPLLRIIAEAERAFTQGNNQKAVSHYTQVIEDPRSSQLEKDILMSCHLNRGLVLRKLGHQQDALQDYARVVELNPRSFKPHLNAALIYAQDLERYPEALVEFDKAIELNPTYSEAWSSRGLTRMLMDDLEGAEADLKTAIKLEPRSANALCNLGNVYLKREQPGQAAEVYRRALEVNPRDVEIRVNLAIALGQIGEDRAVERVLREDKRALQLWRKKGGNVSFGGFEFSLIFIRPCSIIFALELGTIAMFMYGFTFHILVGAIIGAVLGTILGFLLAVYARSLPAVNWHTSVALDWFPRPMQHRPTRAESKTGVIGSILGLVFGLIGALVLAAMYPPFFSFPALLGPLFGFGAGGWTVSRAFRKLSG